MQYIVESLTTPLNQLTIFQWGICIVFSVIVIGLIGFLLIMQYYILPIGLSDKTKDVK